MNVPTTTTASTLAAALVAAAALLSACASEGDAAKPDPSGATAPGSFAAERMRLLPLTRFSRERDSAGQWTDQLVCHIEFKDRFGQVTKALGDLRIELYRPTGSATDPDMTETQALIWNVDLSNPAENALMYDDLVTRSYIVHLGGLPAWLIAWTQGEGREPWMTIKATFSMKSEHDQEKRLEAVYRVTR
ncbi:MAG: hypothetical protein KF745_14820 [Phycisphaeraceae bacterium]|nr:hypothetical protein [Phycisphaeraceae bacterium]